MTGTLRNGDAFAAQFAIGDEASITLVPEPAALTLAGVAAAMLALFRRRRE